MSVQKNNKVQSKRTSVRRGGDPNVDNEDPGKIINKIIDMLKDLKTTVETIPGPASASASTTGTSSPTISGEEAEEKLKSVSAGGKGKGKGKKKTGKQ